MLCCVCCGCFNSIAAFFWPKINFQISNTDGNVIRLMTFKSLKLSLMDNRNLDDPYHWFYAQ